MLSVSQRTELMSDIKRAAQLHKKGRSDEAVAVYQEVAGRAIGDASLQAHLGHLCIQFENSNFAVKHYEDALQLGDESPDYLVPLGASYMQSGRQNEAETVLKRALVLDTDNPQVLGMLGSIYISEEDFENAEQHLRKAIDINPRDFANLCNLAIAQDELGHTEEAIATIRRAIKSSPKNPEGHNSLGVLLATQGRMDEAVASFEAAIRHDAGFGDAYDNLARARKFTMADRPLIKRTEQALLKSMPALQRSNIHFALGKMYDDCESWDVAFGHYQQANLLAKGNNEFEFRKSFFKAMAAVFQPKFISKIQSAASDSAVPVFIVGMPRSGTTLMEQIVANHTRGAGAGELMELSRICKALISFDHLSNARSDFQKNLTTESVQNYAERYLEVLTRSSLGAARVVDKMPGNYLLLGLVVSLFPNAVIIHATRNPLDTCLSCYFQNFRKLDWSNDLAEVAREYRFYRSVMSHWGRVLPTGRIIEINYEQLVEDPESKARRLQESCGLEWEPESLRFEKRENIVRTASVWQVRQGMYRSSRKRWKNYAAHIDELARLLSDFLDDDRAELRESGIKLKSPSIFSKFFNRAV